MRIVDSPGFQAFLDADFFILRFDDIGLMDGKTQLLLNSLCSSGFKVTLGVVPDWINSQAVEAIKRLADDYPDLVEVHQHGYTHQNYGSQSREYEFGRCRSLSEQTSDLEHGAAKLARAFGELFFRAFNPPFASYDINTVRALTDAGFRLITTLPYDSLSTELNLLNVSPAVDCFRWHPTSPLSWAEVQSALNSRPKTSDSICGLILHPHLMDASLAIQYSSGIISLFSARESLRFSDCLKLIEAHA